MNKNMKIGIIALVILIIIACIFIPKIKSKAKNEIDDVQDNASDILYNEEPGLYYITDENGEIVHESEDEGSLYIYTIDPDYDPKNPELLENND